LILLNKESRIMLSFASICPHPPLIVSTIGKSFDLKKVARTVKAMEKLADEFNRVLPQTVIVISPHGPMLFDYFTANVSPTLSGHFYNFGDFQTEFSFKNDLEFVSNLEKECQRAKIPLRAIKVKELDHGTLVPLYYLTKNTPNIKIVPLSFSYLDIETHFQFGKILQKVINKYPTDRGIAIVASGDLSHRLIPEAPGGFSPRGKEFDEMLVEMLRKKDVQGILNIDVDLLQDAGECGYRSIIVLLGALDGLDYQSEILSYEGPFGVGYLVINFKL